MEMDLNFGNIVSMVENTIAGVCAFGLKQGKITPIYVNEGLSRMLGYSQTDTLRVLRNIRNSIIPDDLEALEQAIKDILKDDGPIDFELRTVTLSGGLRWLQVRANLYAKEGDAYTVLALILDATERKNTEEELKLQAERLHILSAAEGEQIIDYNVKTDVMLIRPSADLYMRNDIIINNYIEGKANMLHPEDEDAFFEIFRHCIKAPNHDTMEFRTNRFDKEYQWYQANITSIAGVEGYITRIVGRIVNINERKKKELELEIRAEKDSLTGLYNKGATEKLVCDCIEEADRENSLHGFMVLDLDNFKTVNDILGHAKGDEILRETAKKMVTIFKGSDIIGRIGGDEFLVFMKDIRAVSNTDVLANRLGKELEVSLPSEVGTIVVSASIGISIFPYHGTTYKELFEKADKALYTAKANGKDEYRIFDAAATLAYHASKRNNTYMAQNIPVVDRKLEDVVLQILYENKEKESALRSILELIATQFGMHRAFICPSSDSELSSDKDIRFAAEGYEAGRETSFQRKIKITVSEILSHRFKNLTVLHHYDDLPDEVMEYMIENGVRCLMYYPLYKGSSCMGAILFENHVNDELDITQEQKDELKCLLRIVNAYVLQLGLVDRMNDMVTQIELLDNMDTYVYVVDAQTYQISFVNKKVALKTPDLRVGEYCYKAICGQDSPCEDCIMQKLDKRDPHSRVSEEVFNFSLRAWTKNSACWLECNENDYICMMNCIDISEYFIG